MSPPAPPATSASPTGRLRAGGCLLLLPTALFVVACASDGGGPAGDAGCEAGEQAMPDGSCQPAAPDTACPFEEIALPDGSCQPPGLPPDMPCPPGQLALPDGSCQPAGLPPDMPCPPGQLALPDGTCRPAGVPPEACAAGRFVPDGRGGCAPILPDATCPLGQTAVPGDSACREVAPCGEGVWDAAIPEGATTLYVDQAYAGSDSDGSRERPWTTVQAGVDAAPPGAIVAVAAGSYAEDVLVEGKPIRLWGLCPARTTVIGLGVRDAAVLIRGAGAAGSEVRRIAATGPKTGILAREVPSVMLDEVWVHEAGSVGVVVFGRASATLRGALLEHNQRAGVVVWGSTLAMESTAVRATQLQAGQFGWGVASYRDNDAGAGAQLSIVGSLVEESRDVGVVVGSSDATIDATVIRRTLPNSAGEAGYGIKTNSDWTPGVDATLRLTSSVVDDNRDTGLYLIGGEVTVESTVVRGTRPDEAGKFGRGVDILTGERAGARVRLASSLVEGNHDMGVFVLGSEATVESTAVRGTQPDGAGERGRGIDVEPYGTKAGKLWLSASVVEDNHDIGVSVSGSEATVESTWVRRTLSNGLPRTGTGLHVFADPRNDMPGNLSVKASLVEENSHIGFAVLGGEATVESTVVRANRPIGADELGRGVEVEWDPLTGMTGKLRLVASLVEDNTDTGVFILSGEATIEASVVRGTQMNGQGVFGRGIAVQRHPEADMAGKLELSGSLLENNHELGMFIDGSEATIASSIVRATQVNGTWALGRGINVQANAPMGAGSKLALTSSIVEENRDIGVFVSGSEVTVASTIVRGTKRALVGEGFGDGFMVQDERGASHAALFATEATGNARVGVMYVGSTGELTGVTASNNQFGLVLQSGTTDAQPVLGERNVFTGNRDQDETLDGDLPVPDAAPPLP